MAHALGLADDEVDDLLSRYESIVASVTSITAGHGPTERGADAYAALRGRLRSAIAAGGPAVLSAAAHDSAGHAALLPDEIASNRRCALFGGIETTEGMIANAALELLRPRRGASPASFVGTRLCLIRDRRVAALGAGRPPSSIATPLSIAPWPK